MEISIYQNKRLLFFNIFGEIIVFNMEELLSKEANKIVFKRISDLKQIPEPAGFVFLVKNHTYLAILNVFDNDLSHLQMRRLDFWNVE